MIGSLIGIIASSGGAAGGDYESIATVTVGSGGSSSISFTSIPSTYQHLQIRAISRSATAGTGNQELLMRYNGSSTNYYRMHQLYGDGAGAFAGVNASTAENTPFYTPTAGQTANVFAGAVIDILDYANTNKNKTVRSLTGFDLNGSGFVIFRSGLWMNTSAISSISLTADASGTIAQYSSFALYGIKG
jgi:hypothetical protein